jgi:ABC-type spermidine/putrescine transport system permease subunit I
MLVCGFVLCMASIGRSRSLLSRYGARIEKERRWAFGSVISIALILVVAVVYTSLFVQKSLFVSEGIQQKMAFEIPALLNLRRPCRPFR